MRRIWLLISLISYVCYGQNDTGRESYLVGKCAFWESENLDSLSFYFNQLKKPSSELLQAYFNYFEARLANDSSSVDLYKLVIDKGIQKKDFTLAGLANYRLGRMASADGKYENAMLYYERAHSLFDRSTENSYFNATRKKCVTYTSQAYISNQTNNYEDGIRFSLESLRIAEENDFDDLRLVSILNLSASYGELSSPDNRLGTEEERARYGLLAKQYMFRAAHLAEEIEDLRRAHRSYGNIGIYYTYEGILDSAEFYLNKAISIGIDIDDKRGLVNDYNMLSLVFQKRDQLEKADEMSMKAMEYARELGSDRLIADILLTLGELAAKRDDLNKARKYLKEAIELSRQLGTPKTASHALDQLSTIETKEGNWKDAYQYYQQSIMFRDSVAGQENFNRIEELKTQYETEKKEQQIVSLEQQTEIANLKILQQNLLLFVESGLAFLLIIVGYYFYRNRTLRLAQQRLITEQQLLRSQMNPHFLFNALSSIHSFIFKGDKREAAEYLTTFSELTRDILDHSAKEWITLKKELTTLERYMQVQQLRFPEVRYEIITGDLETEDLLVPPMLLQPFAENAFEHGFRDQTEGQIVVRINQNGDQILFEIEDNGRGLGASKSQHESKAIKIAMKRLLILFGKNRFTISIADRKDINGVLVSIAIPKEELV